MHVSKKQLLMLSLYGAVATATLLPLGCGGGTDSQVPTPTPIGATPTPFGATPTPAPAAGRGNGQFTIDWTQPPSGSVPIAANSLLIVVKQGIEPIFQQVITRPTGSNTSTLNIPNLPEGTLGVLVNAYPTDNATGVPQASSGFTIAIADRVTTSKTLLLTSAVARVIVTTLQPTLTNTSTSNLFATALNADGNLVLTAPTRWTWRTDNPQIIALTATGNQATVQQGPLDGVGTVTVRETETGLEGKLTLSAPETRQSSVTADIAWGARSRATGGLNSALSARILVEDSRPFGTLSFVANRDSRLAAYSQSYTATDSVRTGAKTITVTFYTNPDAQGAIVGVARGSATLLNGTTNIGNFTTEGTIKSLSLTLGSSNIFVNRSAAIVATARDSNNAILALSPGSFTYSVTTGSSNTVLFGQDINKNDILTGAIPGTIQLTASVDGLVSAPATLTITPLGGVILDID
jgi:hypothetical protein